MANETYTTLYELIHRFLEFYKKSYEVKQPPDSLKVSYLDGSLRLILDFEKKLTTFIRNLESSNSNDAREPEVYKEAVVLANALQAFTKNVTVERLEFETVIGVFCRLFAYQDEHLSVIDSVIDGLTSIEFGVIHVRNALEEFQALGQFDDDWDKDAIELAILELDVLELKLTMQG